MRLLNYVRYGLQQYRVRAFRFKSGAGKKVAKKRRFVAYMQTSRYRSI